MKLLAAAGLAGACFAASPLLAADLLGSAPPPMDMPQAELGSNWYIRGDVGYGQTNQATVVPEAGLFPSVGNAPIGDPSSPVPVTRGDSRTVIGADFGLGFGYRLNDWFRVDADWLVSKGPGAGLQQTVTCPEIANAVTNYNYFTAPGATTPTQTAVPFGYQYDYTTCNGKLNVSQYNNTGLVMGYVDLGHWGLFTPYIGAGAGLNVNTMTGSLTFNQTDTGVTYAGPKVTGAAPGVWAVNTGNIDQQGNPVYGYLPRPAPTSGVQQPVGPANWNRSINVMKYTFAASIAAGLGMQISQSATLDLAYHAMMLDVTGGVKGLRQSVSLGVRYNIN